jgi:ABC-type Fe3+/spermidine/putrescine transport system ATPase subunit
MVKVSEISKRFVSDLGDVRAVKNVSFDVPEGHLVTLLGASGCGKTTLLRCIAGLERPESGSVSIDGHTIFAANHGFFEPPETRPIGMVFQSYAVWPHMTVFENVAYPLLGRKIPKKEIARRVDEVLTQVGLAELTDRPAPHLSGGQQQRVALARALVGKPKVLLLDEPLSNLDAKLRCQMRLEIRRLQRQTGVTMLYVTHDQEEAIEISDEILFLWQGEVIERGRPEDIYARPKSRLTAEFFGDANFVRGKVVDQCGENLVVETTGGKIRALARRGYTIGDSVDVFFRPEDVVVNRQPGTLCDPLRGIICEIVFSGRFMVCAIDLGRDTTAKAYVRRHFQPELGEKVYLTFEKDAQSITFD